MSKTRRPLGSLSSVVNVYGEGSLERRVMETTPIERHTRRMYQRREEAWRTLNRQRVAAFLRLFILCFVETENGHRLQPLTYRMLRKTLLKRILPWIHNRFVFTMDEMYWPITLQQFRELDQYLADHLPIVHRDDDWAAIGYFLIEVLCEREKWQRIEKLEREATEAYERCMARLNR